MKMNKNKLVIMFILILFPFVAKSQVSTEEKPVSFSLNLKTKIPAITMPPVDTMALINEDKIRSRDNTPKPFRFGYAIDVSIDLKKFSIKKQLPNGDKLYLLKIYSEGAYSINFIFDSFKLSKGSKFFVYNEDRTMTMGAFTPELNNNIYNKFATDLVQGSSIILEYYEPEYSNDGVINISNVIHGYINTFGNNTRGYGHAANCHIDVNCPLGNSWQNEKRAVSMMLVDLNTGFCTGCLINNVREDCTPFYLTARHCLCDEFGINIVYNPAIFIYRFKYWKSGCNSGDTVQSEWRSISGSTLVAEHYPTDMALLKLNTKPPANYDLYYAGWDRSSTPATSATGIHHPAGDVMKISYAANSAIPFTTATQPVGSNNHWRVSWTQGIIQAGSSGSPLFNQNHRIVGQLQRNTHDTSCNHPYPIVTDKNACLCALDSLHKGGEYGRFDLSWEGGGTKATRLKDWLDPDNTDKMFVNGKNYSGNCNDTTGGGGGDTTNPGGDTTNPNFTLCDSIVFYGMMGTIGLPYFLYDSFPGDVTIFTKLYTTYNPQGKLQNLRAKVLKNNSGVDVVINGEEPYIIDIFGDTVYSGYRQSIDFIFDCPSIPAAPYDSLTMETFSFDVEICAEVDTSLCCDTTDISFPCYKLLKEGGIVNPGGDCSGTVAVYYELYGIPPISPKLHIAIYNDLGYKVKDVMSKVPTKLTDTLSISSLPPGDYKAAFLIGNQLEVVPFTVEGIIKSAVMVPNPSSGLASINYILNCLPASNPMKITVHDIPTGNQLMMLFNNTLQPTLSGSIPIDISSLTIGTYLLKIEIAQESFELPIGIIIMKDEGD